MGPASQAYDLGYGKGIVFSRSTTEPHKCQRDEDKALAVFPVLGSRAQSTHCKVQPGERALLCCSSHASRSHAKARGC